MTTSPSLRRRRVALASLALPLAHTLAAAQVPTALAPVVVTATRTPQPSRDVLADLRLIDSRDIERAGPMTLTELLQLHGGAEIVANGGPGQVSGVFLRGSNTNHVVVLVDGVRINSAAAGTTAFENIPLAQIERIEVVRAPASSLYGADAIGGVIQIFTKQAGSGAHARIGVGTWHTRDASAGFGRQFGATRVSLHAGYRESRAFSATNAGIDPAGIPPEFGQFNPDDDAYRNRNVGLGLLHQWATGHSVGLRALHSDGSTHFDAGPASDDVNRQRLSSLALESRNRLSAQWNSLLRVARGADHSDSSGASPSRFDTDQDQLTWQNDIDALGGLFAAGFEWRREKLGSDTAFTRTRRYNRSLFGGYSASVDSHLVHAALRHDDNSQFGGHSTGSLGYGYRVTPAWRLSASAGTAFKAPSFNDLYFPLTDFAGGFSFSGNPNLRPERSKTAEVAARYEQGGASGGLTLFESRSKDLITGDPTFTTVINVNRARIRGATLNAGIASGIWSTRAEVTHQQAIDADTRTRLVRRAANFGSASFSVAPQPWRFGAELVASGARFDSVANTPASRMGGYTLVHLHAAYALTRELALSARVNNATDKGYELAQGYNTPRRNVFVALDWSAQ